MAGHYGIDGSVHERRVCRVTDLECDLGFWVDLGDLGSGGFETGGVQVDEGYACAACADERKSCGLPDSW